ncbi:MAG: hypothetical protein ABT940_12610 [Alphaproteobacteria bacterium]
MTETMGNSEDFWAVTAEESVRGAAEGAEPEVLAPPPSLPQAEVLEPEVASSPVRPRMATGLPEDGVNPWQPLPGPETAQDSEPERTGAQEAQVPVVVSVAKTRSGSEDGDSVVYIPVEDLFEGVLGIVGDGVNQAVDILGDGLDYAIRGGAWLGRAMSGAFETGQKSMEKLFPRLAESRRRSRDEGFHPN